MCNFHSNENYLNTKYSFLSLKFCSLHQFCVLLIGSYNSLLPVFWLLWFGNCHDKLPKGLKYRKNIDRCWDLKKNCLWVLNFVGQCLEKLCSWKSKNSFAVMHQTSIDLGCIRRLPVHFFQNKTVWFFQPTILTTSVFKTKIHKKLT